MKTTACAWRSSSDHSRRFSEEPFKGDPIVKSLEKSSIAQALKAARASLNEPSRPYTPLNRSLFQLADVNGLSRPTSSYNVNQLAFVQDTYKHKLPEALRSTARLPKARSWCTPISEEDSRRQSSVDILSLEPREAPPPTASRSTSRPPGPGSLGLTVGPSPATDSAPSRGSAARGPLPADQRAGPPSEPPPTLTSSASEGALSLASDVGPRCVGVMRTPLGRPPLPAGVTPANVPTAVGAANVNAQPCAPPRAASQPVRVTDDNRGEESAWRRDCESVIARLGALVDSAKSGFCREQMLQMSDQVLDLAARAKEDSLEVRGNRSPRAPRLLHAVLRLLDSDLSDDGKCTFKLSRCALALLTEAGAVRDLDSAGIQAAYLNISKVLFKRSKTERHDVDFLTEGLLPPLLRMLKENFESKELMIYVVGCLKNVAIDEANQQVLLEQGALPALFGLMQKHEITGSSEEAPLLIQITATLRSLAGPGCDEFAEDILHALTRLLELFPKNVELLTNVSRTLAKLTLHTPVCEALALDHVHVRRISNAVRENSSVAPLVLRLSFVLGNLTAKIEGLRESFALACGGTTLVPQLVASYWQRERTLAKAERERGSEMAKGSAMQEIDEVLVKLVRLIANMAISPQAGAALACDSKVVDPLIDMLGAKRIGESEELVLNVVAAITNLLFYNVSTNLLFNEENKQLLCRLFRPLLLESYNVEALIETARALGNLSRHKDGRRCMSDIRLDEILTILLDHDDRDLVFYVCGTLVNIAADAECGLRLARVCPVVGKLATLLADAPSDDPELRLVTVQVLTNLSLAPTSSWPTSSTLSLRETLQRLLAAEEAEAEDDETASCVSSQFYSLARELFDRLPPVSSSDEAKAKESP